MNQDLHAIGPEVYITQEKQFSDINREICRRVALLKDTVCATKTHYFGERYENCYIKKKCIPQVEPILQKIGQYGRQILKGTSMDLEIGFWFNSMQPGDSTYPHEHRGIAERLSGCYYLDVPPDSGNILLTRGEKLIDIKPEEGTLIFFPPDMEHAVTTNCSNLPRLSLAFNLSITE